MTGNLALDLLISLAGIGLVVGASYVMGGWRSVALDRERAAAQLAIDEPDFAPGDWLVSRDARAALALSADGREGAVVFAVGDRLATRRAPLAALRAAAEDEKVLLRLDDPSLRRVRLDAGDAAEAARWASRLAGAAYTPGHGDGVS